MAEENGEKNGKGLFGRVRKDINDLRDTIKEKGKDEIEGLKEPEKTQVFVPFSASSTMRRRAIAPSRSCPTFSSTCIPPRLIATP